MNKNEKKENKNNYFDYLYWRDKEKGEGVREKYRMRPIEIYKIVKFML